MTTETTTAALTGPWLAVVADRYGFVYDSVADAKDSAEDDEVKISVVRGTAMPNDRNGTTGVLLRLPGSHDSGDVAYELDDVYLDDEDESVAADARYAQAQAMAAGLNAAAEATR